MKSGGLWSEIPQIEVRILFYGEYQHSLDEKGRIIIPSKFREGLGDKFIITKGLDGCLFVYSPVGWVELERKLKELPFTDKDVRAFVRFFFSGASECKLDKQGRTLVPVNLREYASLQKEIYVIGVSSRVEIWDREKWDKYNDDDNIGVDKIAEKMSILGI